MMRISLCALNAKYIHSSLALNYLNQALSQYGYPIETLEFTINEPPGFILSEIYLARPDVIGFSCYIWNIQMVLRICRDMKAVKPEVIIVLGGPEVSFDAEGMLLQHPYIDYILCGEGEKSLPALLTCIANANPPSNIPGLWSRRGDQILSGPPVEPIEPMDDIPFPYPSGIPADYKRIIYYETSRGCPYRCSYCLSAQDSGVRFLSMERVKRDLAILVENHPREIKFVDRTFNCHETRAREIMEYLLEISDRKTRFHFEICADLLSEDMLSFLGQVPSDRFDFEIGVQSTHPSTLRAIQRHHDWPRLAEKISILGRQGNLHLHLDLIAGLPEESYPIFARSFNDVYQLKPRQLQLGFLKFLKGSPLRGQSDQLGYRYQSSPPYQVLASPWLAYEELVKLTHVEDVVEKYYNTGIAVHTIATLIENLHGGDPFAFYSDFAGFWHAGGWFAMGTGVEERLWILKQYLSGKRPQAAWPFIEILKYDYLSSRRSYKLPSWLASDPDAAQTLNRLLKNPGFVEKHIPEMIGMTVKDMKKRLILETFRGGPPEAPGLENTRVLLFVYPDHGGPAERIADVSLECCLE